MEIFEHHWKVLKSPWGPQGRRVSPRVPKTMEVSEHP